MRQGSTKIPYATAVLLAVLMVMLAGLLAIACGGESTDTTSATDPTITSEPETPSDGTNDTTQPTTDGITQGTGTTQGATGGDGGGGGGGGGGTEGGGEGGTGSPTSPPRGGGGGGGSNTTAASGGGPAGPAIVQVTIDNRAYSPAEITIKVGDTVVWVNEDSLRHDVIAQDGTFESDLFDPGGTFTFAFSEAGTFPYYCSIHPGMVGTVIVK